MKVAPGFKSHSGWTAMVVLGADREGFHVINRARVELIDEGELWAKQPYHAAEELGTQEARRIVKNGIAAAKRVGLREMRKVVSRVDKLKHEIVGCGVLVPEPMPDWSIEEILSVHFRMHKAEGVLFPEALREAALQCNLPPITIPEKHLAEEAVQAFSKPMERLMEIVAELGRSVGPPWGKDQKTAALAAMIVLRKNTTDGTDAR